MDNGFVWLLFQAPLLIEFGVVCDQKTKTFAARQQFILPMAATGIALLEPGIFCLHDAEGRIWFNRVFSEGEEEGLQMVKIRQTDLTAIDSLKEDCLSVNVIQHSEKHELLRDRNF